MIEAMALLMGLALLIALPLLLLAAVFKCVFWLLLLPFRLLGVALGVVGKLFGALFSAAFSVVGLLAALLIGLLLIVAFPLALIAVAVMTVVGLLRWVGGSSARATA